MANLYINKVTKSNGDVLIDLTLDDVTPDKVAKGLKFHDKTGEQKTGTNTFTVDASEATATAAEILEGKTAGVGDSMIPGTMKNNGALTLYISAATGKVMIPIGFHDGTGYVAIDPAELAKLVPGNIKEGVSILGVTGEFGADDISSQSKEVDPTFEDQTIQPDEGYSFLSSVLVRAIKMTYTDNAAGGQTLTIGA